MASIRKRSHGGQDEAPDSILQQPEPPSMLLRIRNMWQFACLCQWFYIFGSAVKFDSIDIEELEAQCLSPHSTSLQDMGLALLKFLSSHRGLTNDHFDEYTRRQYAAKAPELQNPFGTDEVPAKFSDFTVFQKIRILHQMTLFIMMNPDKLRDRMAEQKDADHDQTTWRIEPFGWDRDDRVYYVLDDNRVYRLTEAPPPTLKPKKNTKKARAQARRSNKRRRIYSTAVDNSTEDEEDGVDEPVDEKRMHVDDDTGGGLGGMKWECVAVALDDLRALLASIPGKRDPNERVLREKIVKHLLPILEQQEERRKKRERERERELLNLARMASAKKSSRIASRQEHLRQEELQREEDQKRRLELEALRRAEQKQRKMERERDNRLLSREKRLHEREIRRAQHEEELAQLSEDSRVADQGVGRMSERRRLTEIQKNETALRELDEEGEEEWVFDCICGLHGKVDDGQHSVSCEKCNIWQHSRCLGIDEAEAEKDDFHFICVSCKRRAEQTADIGVASSRSIIKIKVNKPAEPPNLPAPLISKMAPEVCQISINIPEAPLPQRHVPMPVPAPAPEPTHSAGPPAPMSSGVNGTSVHQAAPSPVFRPPRADVENRGLPIKPDSPLPLPQPGPARSTKSEAASEAATQQNGHTHPFSLSHPSLSRPNQSPRKSQAYDTIFEQHTAPSPARPLPAPIPNVAPPTPTAPPPGISASGSSMTSPFAAPLLLFPQSSSQLAASGKAIPSPPVPSQSGLSPIKHSPTTSRDLGVDASSSPTLAVFPPAAELPPSAPEQNLKPPVKPGTLVPKPLTMSDATGSFDSSVAAGP